MYNFPHKCLCPVELNSKDTVTSGSVSNGEQSQNKNDFGQVEASGPNPIWFGDGSGTADIEFKATMEKVVLPNGHTYAFYQSVVFQDDFKEFSTDELRLQDYMDNRLFEENPNADRPRPKSGTKRFNFVEFKEKDKVANNIIYHQSIMLMPPYRGISQEELRMEDYRQGTVFQGDTSNLVESGISSFDSFGSTTGTFGSSTYSGPRITTDFGTTTNPSLQESFTKFGPNPTGLGTKPIEAIAATSITGNINSTASQGSTESGQKLLAIPGNTNTSSDFDPASTIAGSLSSSIGSGLGNTSGFVATADSPQENSTKYGDNTPGSGTGAFSTGAATFIGSGFGSTVSQGSTEFSQKPLVGYGDTVASSRFDPTGTTTNSFGSSAGPGFGATTGFGVATITSQESSTNFGTNPTGFGTGTFGTGVATSIDSAFGSAASKGSTDFGQKSSAGFGSTNPSIGFFPSGTATSPFGSSIGSGFGTSTGFGAKPASLGTNAFGAATATSIGSGFGSTASQENSRFGQKPLDGFGSMSARSEFDPTSSTVGFFGSSIGSGFGTTTGFGAESNSSFLGNYTGFGAKPTGFGTGAFGAGTTTSIGSGFGSTFSQGNTGTLQIIIPGFGIINRDFGTNSNLGFGGNNADSGNFVTSGFGLSNTAVNTKYPSFDDVNERLAKASGVPFGAPDNNFSSIPAPTFGTSNAAFGHPCNPDFGSSATGFGQNNPGFEKNGNSSFTQASIPRFGFSNTGVSKSSCSCSSTNGFANPPILDFGNSGTKFGQESSSSFGFKSTAFGQGPATMPGTMGNGFRKAPLTGFGAPKFDFGSDSAGSSSSFNGFGQTQGFVNASNSHEKPSGSFFNGFDNMFGQACRSDLNSSWLKQGPMFKNNGFGQPENNGFCHTESNSFGQAGNNGYIQNLNNSFGSYLSGNRQDSTGIGGEITIKFDANSQSPGVHIKYSNTPGVNVSVQPTGINISPHTVQSDTLPSSASCCSNYLTLLEKLKSDLGLSINFKEPGSYSEHKNSRFMWKNNQKAAPPKAEGHWCPQPSTGFPPRSVNLNAPKSSVAEKPKYDLGPKTLFQIPGTVQATSVSNPLSFFGGSPAFFPNITRVSADDQPKTSREPETEISGLKVNDTILPEPSYFLNSLSSSNSPPTETCSNSQGVTAQNNSQHIAKNYPNVMNRASSPGNNSSENPLLVASPDFNREKQPRSEQGDAYFISDIETLPDEQTFSTSLALHSPSLPSDFVILPPSTTIQLSADTDTNTNTTSTSKQTQNDEVRTS